MVFRDKAKDGTTRLTGAVSAVPLTFDAIYPVGCIYTSIASTDPGTLFGGTWAAFATGRMLIGVNPGDPDYNVAEETGGVKDVTLTAAQSGVPAHNHVGLKVGAAAIEWVANSGGTSGATVRGSAGTAIQTNDNTPANASEAHTNMPPYIAVYMWKRTA